MLSKKALTSFGLVATAVLFLGPSPGQDSNYAGAPFDNGTCSNTNGGCHGGGTDDGAVFLTGIPATYAPGAIYPITLTIADADAAAGGFQIVATNGSTNAQVGTFIPVSNEGTRLTIPTNRLTHSMKKDFSGGQVSWAIDWQAPTSGPPANVVFYFVGNATNNDGGTSGDIVYADFQSVALPIELASFTAQPVGGGTVELDWRTASETNNARFSIERSTADDGFEAIGEQKGSGTTTEPHSYAFRDRPSAGPGEAVRYRLRQVDFDGRSTLSKIVSLELGGGAAGLSVWPTVVQAGEALHLSTGVSTKNRRAEVVDFYGKPVKSQPVEAAPDGGFELPTDGLPSGQYWVRIEGGRANGATMFFVL